MKTVSISEFNNLVSPLFGMSVSLPWCGYGSAIFLELGKLQPLSNSRQYHERGEVCISFEWDWRLESDKKIIYGSSNSMPEIAKHISQLVNLKVKEITVEGRVPELSIQFDNGFVLRSMSMVTGDPQWDIRLQDDKWLSCMNGEITIGNGEGTGTTAEEDEAIEHSEITAKRWGAPVIEPKLGDCGKCNFFCRLDGHFSLLDYGVCTSANSPFDGKATNVKSGCQLFSPE